MADESQCVGSRKKAHDKKYRETHQEKRRAQRKAYYMAHRDEARAAAKEWRTSHLEHALEVAAVYRKAHRGELAASSRVYYALHRDAANEKQRTYRQTHRQEKRATDRVYGAQHKQERVARHKAWVAEHPQESLEHWRRGKLKRYRLLAGTRCDLTFSQWEAIKASQGFRCLACGEVRPLTKDHIKPVSLGGEHTASNIQGLCKSCNSQKATRIVDYRNESGV